MKKKVWIFVGGGLLVVIMIIANLTSREKLTEVRADVVVRGPLAELVNASGKLEPKTSVDISATIMGKITRLDVEEGDVIREGQFLLEIDPEEFRSMVRAYEAGLASAQEDLALARAKLEKANLDLDRQLRLRDQGLSSTDSYEEALTDQKVQVAQVAAARARIGQAEANLSKVRHDLSKVTLHSPIEGIVTRLNVEEGENAIIGTMNNPGTLLLTVADLDTMEAEVEVDETEIVRVRLGQLAKIEIDAYPDSLFDAVVTEVGNSPIYSSSGLGQQAVDFKVVLRLETAIEGVRPGLSATADITVAEREDALSIPISALVERKDVEGVFVIADDGEVSFQAVKVGIADEERFEVESGVEEGQLVVEGPFQVLRTLKDGERVKVEEDDEDEDDEDDDDDDSGDEAGAEDDEADDENAGDE